MKKLRVYFITFVLVLKNIEALSSVRHVVRCTRRFTAGYCEEDVQPVWTFSFQQQDCVLRMGCPPSSRVNRFSEREQCSRRCKLLVDLYTQLLLNDTAPSHNATGDAGDDQLIDDVNGVNRRDYEAQPYSRTDILDSKEDPETYEDVARDMPNDYDSEDTASLEDIIPRNIDEDREVHSFLDVFNDDKV